jgi:hypothetical protein
MCTVLITYTTPPSPPAAPGDAEDRGTTESDAASVEQMVAGIDEAIAETVAAELARAGHQVTCRPFVATTSDRGFDLVVVVDHLHVSHHSDPSWPRTTGLAAGTSPYAAVWAAHEGATRVRHHDVAPPRAATGGAVPLGEATIPLTWCADFRAVEAWGRSIGDHLVRFLELRAELVRIRAELARCRALLKAVTPEPRAASAVELGRPVGPTRALHHNQHRASGRAVGQDMRS